MASVVPVASSVLRSLMSRAFQYANKRINGRIGSDTWKRNASKSYLRRRLEADLTRVAFEWLKTPKGDRSKFEKMVDPLIEAAIVSVVSRQVDENRITGDIAPKTVTSVAKDESFYNKSSNSKEVNMPTMKDGVNARDGTANTSAYSKRKGKRMFRGNEKESNVSIFDTGCMKERGIIVPRGRGTDPYNGRIHHFIMYSDIEPTGQNQDTIAYKYFKSTVFPRLEQLNDRAYTPFRLEFEALREYTQAMFGLMRYIYAVEAFHNIATEPNNCNDPMVNLAGHVDNKYWKRVLFTKIDEIKSEFCFHALPPFWQHLAFHSVQPFYVDRDVKRFRQMMPAGLEFHKLDVSKMVDRIESQAQKARKHYSQAEAINGVLKGWNIVWKEPSIIRNDRLLSLWWINYPISDAPKVESETSPYTFSSLDYDVSLVATAFMSLKVGSVHYPGFVGPVDTSKGVAWFFDEGQMIYKSLMLSQHSAFTLHRYSANVDVGILVPGTVTFELTAQMLENNVRAILPEMWDMGSIDESLTGSIGCNLIRC